MDFDKICKNLKRVPEEKCDDHIEDYIERSSNNGDEPDIERSEVVFTIKNPRDLIKIIERLKKLKRIYPRMNRRVYAMKVATSLLRYLLNVLSDYDVKHYVHTDENGLTLHIEIKYYTDEITPQDEYEYAKSILRKAFPELSDSTIEKLTLEVIGKYYERQKRIILEGGDEIFE